MSESSRASWGDLLGRVSDGVLALLKAEGAALQADVRVSLHHLKVLAVLGGVAFACAFWAFGALVAALTLGLGEVMPLWLVALLEGVILLVVAGVAALLIRRRIEGWESPLESTRERFEEHAAWWRTEVRHLAEPPSRPAGESVDEAGDDPRQDGGSP